jgi:hypothetical protein
MEILLSLRFKMEITKQKGLSKVEEIKIESEGLVITKTMNNFLVYYSGGSFERGDTPEQAEKKAYDKVSSLGNVLRIEATVLHPDEKEYLQGNYIVSFEGEIMVEAETKVNAENQVYDQLSHLREVTVEAFKKVQHN